MLDLATIISEKLKTSENIQILEVPFGIHVGHIYLVSIINETLKD